MDRRRGLRLEGLADLRLEGPELRVLGRDGAQTLERETGANEVAELAPRDGAGLREEEGAVAVLDAGRGLFGQIEDAGPVAGLLSVGLAEEEEGAFVLRIELERLLEEASADLEVLVP